MTMALGYLHFWRTVGAYTYCPEVVNKHGY